MITFGITVANEEYEFQRLLDSLIPFVQSQEKIIILADQNKVTEKIKNICLDLKLDIHYFDFQNDFADLKNYLISLVETDYLFQLDADEQVSPSLLNYLRQVLESRECDCVFLPRINIVHGHTNQDIDNFNWTKYGEWICFPDYQARVIKINNKIHWQRPVHEQVVGYVNRHVINYINCPDLFSIIHVKNIQRQRKQNQLYDQIEKNI